MHRHLLRAHARFRSPPSQTVEVAELLGKSPVQLTGLGARDSLRLEAGMCLYGNDLDEDTSPVEAGLTWVIGSSWPRLLCWRDTNRNFRQGAEGERGVHWGGGRPTASERRRGDASGSSSKARLRGVRSFFLVPLKNTRIYGHPIQPDDGCR